MEQIWRMVRPQRRLDMTEQALGLIAGALDDLHRQPLQGRRQRLSPGRRRAIGRVLLQQNEVRDRFQRHQTDRRVEGFIFAHGDLAPRHAHRQGAALLFGQGDDRRFQRRIDLLLRPVGSPDERREPAQLQKLAHHTNPRARQQRHHKLRRQDLALKPLDPLRSLDEGHQHRRWSFPARPRGHTPILQGAARDAQLRRDLSLRVPSLSPRERRALLLGSLQTRAVPHRSETPGRSAAMARLPSNLADASFIASPLGCLSLPRVKEWRGVCRHLQQPR